MADAYFNQQLQCDLPTERADDPRGGCSGIVVSGDGICERGVEKLPELSGREIPHGKGIGENGEEITCTTYKEPPLFAGVCLKDGTIYTAITGAGSIGYSEKNSDLYQEMWALNRVIDVEQVESLLFVKSYPEGEQPLAKENLYFVPVETESK